MKILIVAAENRDNFENGLFIFVLIIRLEDPIEGPENAAVRDSEHYVVIKFHWTQVNLGIFEFDTVNPRVPRIHNLFSITAFVKKSDMFFFIWRKIEDSEGKTFG